MRQQSGQERPLRTLQVISVAAAHFGGPSIGALALHAALREIGHDARMVTGAYHDPDGTPLTETERALIEQGRDRSVVLLEPSRPYALQRCRKAVVTMWREVGRAEAVHLHGQYMWLHVVASIVLRLRRRPYGVQPHGGLEPYQLGVSKRKKAVYDRLVGNRLLREAAYVLFASETEAQRATRVPVSKRLVTALGASLQPATQPTIDVARQIEALGSRNVAIFLGRLASKKRLDLLLKAWSAAAKPPGALLVIAGPDGDVTRKQVMDWARQAGETESVVALGPVEGGEKAWLLERAGTFILPSDNENFGVAVAEALLAGCYCIVSDQVAAGEHVLVAGGGATFPAGDAEALRRCLEASFVLSAERFNQASTAGRSYAEEQLTWTGMALTLSTRMREAMPPPRAP